MLRVFISKVQEDARTRQAESYPAIPLSKQAPEVLLTTSNPFGHANTRNAKIAAKSYQFCMTASISVIYILKGAWID